MMVMWHSGRQVSLRGDLGRESRIIRENGASTHSDSIELRVLLYAAILVQSLRTVGLSKTFRVCDSI